MQPFPTIDQAYDWYVATRDGLASLGSCVWMSETRLNITDKTLDELFGMTESEWNAYYELNLDKHELFSALSLFAACEGGIRRDFDWRVQGDNGQKHHQRFLNEYKKHGADERITLATLIDNWLAAERGNVWLRRQLLELKTLFARRNDLAHGRSGESVSFDVIFEKLNRIRTKWRDGVDDFRGY